ncbi:uncharacterized protein LOC132315863 [Cornus florida]|uniref:uncharacterized protein LOC132315863 n=1 Tax=Cornus florida TaxID=4283 RepID=UPI0028990C6A|nr:uncharacterized protein LOC132315863 [Cornus florida]
MEFFNKAKAVRLRSHLDKYLVADEDEETVRQSRNSSTHKARWTVEMVEGKSHVIRLKSCNGKYLTALDEDFLLGWTGKKVLQTIPATMKDGSIEWEPIKEGSLVKLRTKGGGKFLRANWGTPPWRNSVTHDVPYTTATQDWVLWEVEMVEMSTLNSYDSLSSHESLSSCVSPALSFSSALDDVAGINTRSPSMDCGASKHASGRQNGMEFFDKAKAVKLQSHLGKYLLANEDEETVRQSRNGATSRNARWTVEFIEGKNNAIRLKSCHGKYLTATDEPFLLGLTGKKVLQTIPATKMNNAIEWEPIKEGFKVKLRSRDGKFLRANGGTPPWRNSITHDVPNRTATQDWVLWGVDVVDISVSESEPVSTYMSSSFSPLADDYTDSPINGSPLIVSGSSGHVPESQEPFF